MRSLDDFARDKLAGLESRALRRKLAGTSRLGAAKVLRDGQRLVSFSCSDYLGLSNHPAVIEAAERALREFGLGAGGSRLVTGNHPLFAALETRLATWKGAERALIFGSGYMANLGVIPALVGKGDVIIADELSHACLLAAARLSGAETFRYAHKDVASAARLIEEHRRRARHALIITDGVFSMDGDLADLPALSRIAEEHDAWLLVDDAHGLGIVGGGRGAVFAFGQGKIDVPLETGALSKALGSYGGYLCASAPVVELMHSRARTFVYSTGLPPPVIAGALAALDYMIANPDYACRPQSLAKTFAGILGLPEAQSAIVPLVLGTAEATLEASAILRERGYLVTAIRPPTVPEGTSRLRFAFSAAHREQDVIALAELVRTRILKRKT